MASQFSSIPKIVVETTNSRNVKFLGLSKNRDLLYLIRDDFIEVYSTVDLQLISDFDYYDRGMPESFQSDGKVAKFICGSDHTFHYDEIEREFYETGSQGIYITGGAIYIPGCTQSGIELPHNTIKYIPHRNHVYFVCIDSKNDANLVLKRIQIKKNNPRKIKVEDLDLVLTDNGFHNITASDSYNRLLIQTNEGLTVFDLASMKVSSFISSVHSYNNEHALVFDKDTKKLMIHDLNDELNTTQINLSQIKGRISFVLADKYVLVKRGKKMFGYAVDGRFCFKISDKHPTNYFIAMLSFNDFLIFISKTEIHRYDMSRFNAIERMNVLLCGDINSKESAVQTYIRSRLFERHTLCLIAEFL